MKFAKGHNKVMLLKVLLLKKNRTNKRFFKTKELLTQETILYETMNLMVMVHLARVKTILNIQMLMMRRTL